MSEYIRTNKFDTNECPNIFVKEKLIRMNIWIYSHQIFWHEWITEYIRIICFTRMNLRMYSYKKLIRTNIRINICVENIRIFEYICHTLPHYHLDWQNLPKYDIQCHCDHCHPNQDHLMLENNHTSDDAVVPNVGPVLAAGHLLWHRY